MNIADTKDHDIHVSICKKLPRNICIGRVQYFRYPVVNGYSFVVYFHNNFPARFLGHVCTGIKIIGFLSGALLLVISGLDDVS